MIVKSNLDTTQKLSTKLIRIFSVLLIYITCVQCTQPAYKQEADKIKKTFSKKMEAEGLFLISAGGVTKEDIKNISLSYITYRNLDIAKARVLFIQKAEQLLCLINSSPNIQPYLHDHPFTSKNISLKISFLKFNEDFVEKPYVALVSLNPEKNLISYFFYDLGEDRLKITQEESYEEALKKYYASKRSENF